MFYLLGNFIYGQNTFIYTTYKMYKPNKVYNIFVNYDDKKNLKNVLISVESNDPLYNKSKFIIKKDELNKFTAYLAYISSKKTEWDYVNLKNKTSKVNKEIIWDEGDVTVNCIYEGGPIKSDVSLQTNYIYEKSKSGVHIATPNSSEVNSSIIYFESNKLFAEFINKLDLEKIQAAIDNDFNKTNLLK